MVDTNILLRMCEPNHSMYSIALEATETLLNHENKLYIAPQNIVEFWNVATRPKDKNGLGMSTQKAQSEILKLETIFTLKLDLPDIHKQWFNLIVNYEVKGVNVHDTRLVAFALVHGLTHILTFNVKDFKRYQEITVVSPKQLVA